VTNISARNVGSVSNSRLMRWRNTVAELQKRAGRKTGPP
jgi:hypothetical protein